MNKLKILRLGDVYGWAYHFIAQNQQKYSKHEIIYKLRTELTPEQIIEINPDIVYFHCPEPTEINTINNLIKSLPNNIKIIGGYAGESKHSYISAHLIVSISYPFLSTIKSLYPNKGIIFLPEGVDETFFTPKIDLETDKFIVGWAGRPHVIKRAYLLGMLKYPVQVAMNYGKKYFKKNRTLKSMKEFYHNLDVFILPSRSEASSTVTMEAMANGLPVIATDVGNIRMLLDPEWIVPNTTDKEIIKGINCRLDLLKENPQLRKEVGECNRLHIEKYFTWKQNQIIWDEVYSALVVNNYERINELSENYLKPFKKLY